MKIAFLCVANSARSQMAEGIGRKIFENYAEVISAGSQPSRVNPLAIEALKEIGIDISTHTSKSTADIDFKSVDLVVTLCAEEVCPIVPRKTKKIHWPFADPAAAQGSASVQMQSFRDIRDQIKEKIFLLRDELFRAAGQAD